MGVATTPSTPLGALGVTLERSKQLCLQMYEKELLTYNSYQALTTQLVCTPEQLAVFAGEHLLCWQCVPRHSAKLLLCLCCFLHSGSASADEEQPQLEDAAACLMR